MVCLVSEPASAKRVYLSVEPSALSVFFDRACSRPEPRHMSSGALPGPGLLRVIPRVL